MRGGNRFLTLVLRCAAPLALVPMLLVPVHAEQVKAATKTPATYVYFDQKEEQDYYRYPGGPVGTGKKALIPPWDPNGQMCLWPDNSGRFVTGYNPTSPDQTETVGRFKPYKQPPAGEALWNRDGTFSGKTFYASGPYKADPGKHAVTGKAVGGDDPPDSSGSFHTNATFTGCAFNSKKVLFGADIGTAQGDFPPPDNGRILEWFPPSYTSYCILLGPTKGGLGAHHVAGTGGLRDPAAGAMAVDAHDNLLVPLPFGDGAPPGYVAKLDAATIPKSAKECPSPSNAPRKPVKVTKFISGQFVYQPIPVGIARDPACKCWAVSSIFGAPSVAWYDDDGTLLPPGPLGKGPLLGGGLIGTFDPLGLAFAPDGTLFFVDTHLSVGVNAETASFGIGPQDGAGALYEVTFDNGVPGVPRKVYGGESYPVSVTTCTPSKRVCPHP